LKQSVTKLAEYQQSGEVPEIRSIDDDITELSKIFTQKGDDQEDEKCMTPEQLSDFIQDELIKVS
jgi:hypothetical protein